jgi:hypothetical protein
MCCGHAELSIRCELCGRWININHPHSTLCQPAVVASELINHTHFILFLFRIGCHVKLSVTYKLRKSDELLLPIWLIQCVECIVIQHYFNPTTGNSNNKTKQQQQQQQHGSATHLSTQNRGCRSLGSFFFSIFLHSHKTLHKIFQFLITVFYLHFFTMPCVLSGQYIARLS